MTFTPGGPMVPLSLLLAVSRMSLAAAPAYYHPDDVAAKSARFAEVAKTAAPAFDAAQKEMTRLGDALRDLEIGVGLLGLQAPPALTTWATQTRHDGMAGFLNVQRYGNQVQDGYSAAFQAALDRALPRVSEGRDVKTCQAKRVMGPGMAMVSCVGEDLNGALAAAMDADPQLEAALRQLGAGPWPTVSLTPAPQPVVAITGAARWISVARVADVLLNDRLSARAEALEDALAPLEDGLDAKDSAALAKAEQLKAAYVTGLGTDGEALRAALQGALARAHRDVPGEIGLCANPSALGGCAGEDVTATLIPIIQADKKIRKDLERRLVALP